MGKGGFVIAQLILLGTMTVTSYQAIPAQTKPECINRLHCTTSIDDGITRYGCAVSQDLLKSGEIHYGDVIYIPGFGYRVVNDTMHPRHMRCVDLLVFTRAEEKMVGVRKLKIYVVSQPERGK
jgi:3D (Asp-Asp-Asp) domain-containing protein